MQSTLPPDLPQPPPTSRDENLSLDESLSLDEAISLLKPYFGIGQILALRTTLRKHKVDEIVDKVYERQSGPHVPNSMAPPNTRSSYRSVNSPALHSDQSSLTSEATSRFSTASTVNNVSRPSSEASNLPTTMNPLVQGFPTKYWSSSAPYQPQSVAEVNLNACSPISEFTSPPTIADNPSSNKNIVKPIPCPEPNCSYGYHESAHLLEHMTAYHDQDMEFECTHPNCGKITYSDKTANRHHTNCHKTCPKRGVDCRTRKVVRTRKYWACDICLSPPFLKVQEWAIHYCHHCLTKSGPTDTSTGNPKDRVSLTTRILNLLQQQATKPVWDEYHQKRLQQEPGFFPQYHWDTSDDILREILPSLQWGNFEGRPENTDEVVGSDEAARRLVHRISNLSRVKYQSIDGGSLMNSKRRASTSPSVLQFGHDEQTIASCDPGLEKVEKRRGRQFSPGIVDDFILDDFIVDEHSVIDEYCQ